MTFIITLISLIIERFFHWSHVRYWRWFGQYQRWLGQYIANWPSYALLIVCVLPIVVVVGLIDGLLDNWLYGILKLLFGVLVLVYCMGPENLWVQVYSCLNELQKEDPKAAVDYAQNAFVIPVPTQSQAFHQSLTNVIFIAAHERVFAVIFWFIILGPLGAVLYRTIALCAKQSDLGIMVVAKQAQRTLDWIPARLFTFIFALAGHFTEVFAIWKKDAPKGINDNDKLISDCGNAALDIKKDNLLPEDGFAEKTALDLLDRVFLITLVILAVIVLIAR